MHTATFNRMQGIEAHLHPRERNIIAKTLYPDTADAHPVPQAMAELQAQLRHHRFQEYDRSPRMLPRAYNPVRLDVDCSNKTPPKAPAASKWARGGAALGARLDCHFILNPCYYKPEAATGRALSSMGWCEMAGWGTASRQLL